MNTSIDLDGVDLREHFVLSAGPGGQNVNKVATAVELRVVVDSLRMLDDAGKDRLRRSAGSRLTQDDEIVIIARRFRSQERNRQDARARLIALIEQARRPKKIRKKTRKPAKADERRLEEKRRRGVKKKLRGEV